MEDHFQTLNYLALFNAESSNTPILTILSTKKKKNLETGNYIPQW